MHKIPKALKIGVLLVGGFVVLLLIEVAMVFRRDFPLMDPEQPVNGEFGDPSLPSLKFVVLGDSTSVGVGTTPDKSFPWLLAERLGERYYVKLNVVGVGGATTTDVIKTQVQKAIDLEPDLMLVEIGANDVTHVAPPWKVRKNFRQTLERLGATEAALVVAGPPEMGNIKIFAEPLRTLSGLQGDNVTRVIEQETRKAKLPYIDLAGGIEALDVAPDFPYFSVDAFHPGEGGYSLWAKVMYPEVSKAADRAVTARASAQGGHAAG